MNRKLVIGLCVSLGLNVFLVGAIAGGLAMRERAAIPAPAQNRAPVLRQAIEGLPQPSRQALRRKIRVAMRGAGPLAADARASRTRAAELIAAPRFDRAAADAALDRARLNDMAIRTRLERATLAAIGDLPAADRQAMGRLMLERSRAEQRRRQAAKEGAATEKAGGAVQEGGVDLKDEDMKAAALAITLAAAATGAAAQTPPQAAAAPPARGAGMFKAADTDGDGALSKAEWLAAGRREQGFAHVDANKDGKATREELIAMREKLQARRAAPPKAD